MRFRFGWCLVLTLALVGTAWAQSDQNLLSGLAHIQDGVKSKRISSYDRSGGNNDRFEAIQDGETRVLADIQGAGMINHIWVTISDKPPKLSRHDIILRMYWDGQEFPSVEAPIGDFFGQGWDETYPFSSLPLAAGPVDGNAMVCYFVMPFSKGARIEITNDTGQSIRAFYYYIDYVEMNEIPADMGRFHAWYNHQLTEGLPANTQEREALGVPLSNTDGARNYLIANIEGKGHFVGVNYYVHSPTTIWYGEGDDMFFIDGEAWPGSLHGTGTEDYFNTSWCPKEPFQHPFYGYARLNNDIGWLGRTHVYRFHINDPIHFDKSLRFSMEHGHNNDLTLDLSSVAYWYQMLPGKPFPPFPSREERAVKKPIDVRDIHRWRDAWRKSVGGDETLWGNEK